MAVADLATAVDCSRRRSGRHPFAVLGRRAGTDRDGDRTDTQLVGRTPRQHAFATVSTRIRRLSVGGQPTGRTGITEIGSRTTTTTPI